MAEQQQNSLDLLKQNLIEYVKIQVGDQIIDIELDPAHYEAAYQKTVGTYKRFNVSEWSGLNEGGEEAAETVMRRSMPTWDYMLMHPAARLSASETKELVTGLVATFGG